jgi:Family of unknown function (DUF5990)
VRGTQRFACSRRLKVLHMTNAAWQDPAKVMETQVSGTGRDGGPNCATVKPFDGWKLAAAP